jgi:hypothetical protein
MDDAKTILGPILSVFGGEDGGCSFSTLRHSILPEMISKSDSNVNIRELLEAFKRVSRVCDKIYKGELK